MARRVEHLRDWPTERERSGSTSRSQTGSGTGQIQIHGDSLCECANMTQRNTKHWLFRRETNVSSGTIHTLEWKHLRIAIDLCRKYLIEKDILGLKILEHPAGNFSSPLGPQRKRPGAVVMVTS